MSFKIITHSGKAHMDELLGIALISIHKGIIPDEIIRVHPDEAVEMIKNETEGRFYVDCGLKFDPTNGYFDHHQSKNLDCAAMLIFECYFKNLIETQLYEYIKLVSLVDTKGPNSLDDFKFNSSTITYFSFSQKLLLRYFEDSPLIVIKMFIDGIKSIIDFEQEKKVAEEWIKTEGNISYIQIKNVKILKYNNPPPSNLSGAVKAVDGEIIDQNNIHLIYSFDKDNNNNIRTLYRTVKGDDIVDLTKSNVKNIQFCHKGGFLLKFIPENENDWERIIDEAIK